MKRSFRGSLLNARTGDRLSQANAVSEMGSFCAASKVSVTRPNADSGAQLEVPLAMIEEILLYLPAHQVVRVCRLVCHEWKELVDSAAHWRERCRREGIQPCVASRPPEDWCQFYILNKNRRNLIKNPKAEDGLQGWEIVGNGDACWLIKQNRKPFPGNTVRRCFVSSNGLCSKRQLIDLQKEGYSAAFMDQFQPHIKISDWYTTNTHYNNLYQVNMQLLNEEMQAITSYNPYRMLLEGDNYPWCEIAHVFQNYGPGVRFIRFTHGGLGTQTWRGHNGIRLTNSSVEICPAAER